MCSTQKPVQCCGVQVLQMLALLYYTWSSLLLGLMILDLQDLLLPRFSGPSRGSRRTFLAKREGGSLGDPPGPEGILPWGLSLCRGSPPRTSRRSRESGKEKGTGGPRYSKLNCYIKNVVLFEENSILPLPECLEASGVESVWGEVSQESPKNR